MTCPFCLGVGRLEPPPPTSGFGRGPITSWPSCPACGGTGKEKGTLRDANWNLCLAITEMDAALSNLRHAAKTLSDFIAKETK